MTAAPTIGHLPLPMAADQPGLTVAGVKPDHTGPGQDRSQRERRINLLMRRLPSRMQDAMRWLRRPSARWVRIPAAILLMAGSLLSLLPIFGVWMLPLGLLLLAEDVAPLRRATDRILAWIERRHPRWMGLPSAGPAP